MSPVRLLVGLCVLASIAPASPQSGGIGAHVQVFGHVRDLTADSGGGMLYCTTEGDVGRILPSGSVTLLADAASGPFPHPLQAVCELPNGDVAVIDVLGDIWRLPNAAPPAVPIYHDTYLVGDITDMIVDATGNFLIASESPSAGQRAIDWVSANGQRWAYYLVEHLPLALAYDPLSDGILVADEMNGGDLRLIDIADETHGARLIDGSTNFGIFAATRDGDMAVQADGDVILVGNTTVWFHHRASGGGAGSTSVVATGFGILRGVAIAASSGNVTSPTGWSAYVVMGQAPATIVEIGGVGAPAPTIASPTGLVPNRGLPVTFWGSLRVYDMIADADGELIVGGDLFNSPRLKRFDRDAGALSDIAGPTDGLSEKVKGLACAEDGTIYALTTSGTIHAVTEDPLSVTTRFADPLDQIVSGWDLAVGADGTLYVADRETFGAGKVVAVSPGGTATTLVNTIESRGVAADPVTGDLFTTEWHNIGFHSTIDRLDLATGTLTVLPGATMLNFSNAEWGDGDLVVDVEGNVYTCSEDDWRVVKWSPTRQRHSIVGAGYLNHPSGLAIARSRPGSGSTTGWSLYVAEFDYLWEIPSVPPPALSTVGCTGTATATPRNGSGQNCAGFTQLEPAIVGGTWRTAIDLGTCGGDVGLVLVSLRGPLAGASLSFGELLVRPPVLLGFGLGQQSLAIPNRCSLVGAPFSTQGATFALGSGQIRLLNALDVVLGTH